MRSATRGESGFTIIEVLIAGLIFTIASYAIFGVVRQMAGTATLDSRSRQNDAVIDRLAAAFSDDASTALAIYNPADDACDGSPTTSIVFYYKNNDGTAQTITYDSDAASASVVRTVAATGARSTYTGVSFSAHCATATALADAENLSSALPGVTIHDYPVNFTATAQTGGNRVMVADIASSATSAVRELHLLGGSIPTGFTILGPQWHTVVYRLDHTRRFLFGLGQVSWLQIWALVLVSYDDWQTQPPIVWCNWQDGEIYGASPKFNQDDVPVFAGAPDADPMTYVASPFANNTRNWVLTADLYPETLLDYCRSAGSPYPPGAPNGAVALPFPSPTPDDQTLAPPAWWLWQYQCDPNSNTCAGDRITGQPAQPYADCDPLTPGSCTVPADPPPGWPAWCSEYSPPVWGAPYFGAPCPAATPPPPPPSPPPAHNSASVTVSGSAWFQWNSNYDSQQSWDGSGTCASAITSISPTYVSYTTATGTVLVQLNAQDSNLNAAPQWQWFSDSQGNNAANPGVTSNPGSTVTVNPDGSVTYSDSITVSFPGPGTYYIVFSPADTSNCSGGQNSAGYTDNFVYTFTMTDQ